MIATDWGVLVSFADLPLHAGPHPKAQEKTRSRRAGFSNSNKADRLDEAFELVFEAGHAAAAVQVRIAVAGPGRVRAGIDIKDELVAFIAPSGAGLILRPVSHDDGDEVIIWMAFGFHRGMPLELLKDRLLTGP